MLDQLTGRLRRFLEKAREGHDLHAPFRVSTHRGHTVQTFPSLESALEAAEALGPDHYVIDRHGLRSSNLTSAKVLAVPPTLLAIGDEVIE